MYKQKFLEENPTNLENEIRILSELGLKDYEIEFILYQKEKAELAKKWQD